MYESGDFVTPTLDRRPWLEKPPLLYWMEVVSFSMFGFGEWQARLPNAFLALLLAAAVGLFAAKMVRRRLGFMVFLILTTSLLYVGYSRAASTDLPLTAAFTLSMISGFLAIRYESVRWALICGGALGFAVLAKGFVAIVLFGGCVLLYLLVQNDLPWLGRLGLVVAVSCFLVAGPWLGLAWMANGENFLITFLVNHHLARYVSDLHHHSQPFWYYLPVLLAGFFPWFTFLPAAAEGSGKVAGSFLPKAEGSGKVAGSFLPKRTRCRSFSGSGLVCLSYSFRYPRVNWPVTFFPFFRHFPCWSGWSGIGPWKREPGRSG